MAAAPPANLRRTSRPIPLLPSGSGGVFDLSSRRHRRGHHRHEKLAERVGLFASSLMLTPRYARGQPSVVQIRSRRICRTRRFSPAIHHLLIFLKLAERAGFEPAKRGLAAYTLSRRAPSTARTPLHIVRFRPGAGYARIIPDARPSLRSGPTCGRPNSLPANSSNPSSGLTRLHTFQACSFDRSDTSPNRVVARGGLRRITGTENAYKIKRGGIARMEPLRGGIRDRRADFALPHPATPVSGLLALGLAVPTWHNGWSPTDRAHELSGPCPQMASEAVR